MTSRRYLFQRFTPSIVALGLSIIMLAAAPLSVAQEPNPDVTAGVAKSGPHQRYPIPLGWKIAIVTIVAVGSGFMLAFATRAWRASNLFDRQYRFPAATTVALRLGAEKSGGCMVVIEFRHTAE
jgi:hypothetical protein